MRRKRYPTRWPDFATNIAYAFQCLFRLKYYTHLERVEMKANANMEQMFGPRWETPFAEGFVRGDSTPLALETIVVDGKEVDINELYRIREAEAVVSPVPF